MICLLFTPKEKPLIPYTGTKGCSVIPPALAALGNTCRPSAKNGGPEGTRTPDLLNAIETRSQLRHRPLSTPALFAARRHQFHRAAARSSACYRRLPGVATHFTSTASRRVRSDGVSLAPTGSLSEKGLTYYSCSSHSLCGNRTRVHSVHNDVIAIAIKL